MAAGTIPSPLTRAAAKAATPELRPAPLAESWKAAAGVAAGAGLGAAAIFKLFPQNQWLTATLLGTGGLILAGSSSIGTWPEELGLGFFAVSSGWIVFAALGDIATPAPPPGGA